MKKLLLSVFFMTMVLAASAQWTITTLGPTTDTITFDATFPGVNNGVIAGNGLDANPAYGQLDSDGWKITGLSDGPTNWGGSYNSGDYAKGANGGGISSGGLYSFGVAAGDSAFGVQPTSSDFTPGAMILRVINNTGFTVDSFFVSYSLKVNNNEDRGNTFNLGYAVNDSANFTFPSNFNYSSIEQTQGSVLWVDSNYSGGIVASIADGDTLYLAWESDDLLGGGSRDEFAIDNIVVHMDTGSSGFVPPAPVIPEYPISTINTEDANGIADSLGVMCYTRGVVVGVDFDGNDGYSFYIMDVEGAQVEGINVYSQVDVNNYVVTEGDSILLLGEVDQFNGLTEFVPDSIALLNQGNPIPDTAVVTTLDESTEAILVRFENALITEINFGANYTLVSGNDTIVMRVDSDTDVDDSLSLAVGDSLCWVVGIGSQYDDFSSPYDGGYQVFPRYYTDIDTSCGGNTPPPPAPAVPFYPIADINNDDANGEPDSLGVYCWTRGVVLGVDLDGNAGISFTLWDQEGINIWNFADVSNYVVTEGDSLMIRGEVDFYNGLTELFPDSIMVLNSGNPIPSPALVDVPSQSTESEPIRIEHVMVIDTAQWPTPGGSSSNVDLLTCNGDTIVMRIDTDTEVDENWPSAPEGFFNVNGIGGQFDGSAPYLEGYQIFPMFTADIQPITEPMAPTLVINELMADNVSAVEDENGDFDDWIELYNTGSNPMPLRGLYLSNDANDPMKYMIPFTNTDQVEPGEYALIWADDEDGEGDLHTNFTLDAAGGYVTLSYAYGCASVVADSVDYIALGADESYGRESDGDEPWVVFSISTPNAMNEYLGVSAINASGLKAWPNPNNGEVLFFNDKVTFQLYSLTGQLVATGARTSTVDLSGLEKGLYLLETTEGDTFKLVIQ
jgi:hypothetical protein